jgi:PAS domain S-box-containing protein
MVKSKTADHSASRGREHRIDAKDQLLCRLETQQTLLLAKIQELEKVGTESGKSIDFASLYERSPVAYITLDPKGHVRNANTAAIDLLKYEKRRVLHLPFGFMVHRDDLKKFWNHLKQCEKANALRISTEVRLQTQARKILSVQLISVPSPNPNGRILFLTAILDLTERDNNTQELEDAKEFSEAIVQTVRHPLAVLDSDLRIVSANRAFARFFKRPHKYIQGHVFEVLLNLWWSGNQLREMLEKALVKNQPLDNFPVAVDLPETGRRVLNLSARPLHQRKTSPDRLLVILEDVSEQEEARQRLRQINEELEQRVAARTEALRKSYEQMEAFCYSIAHDLRAPLRSMTGFSQLLIEQFGEQIGRDGKNYTDRIQQSAERMDRLIQDLLQYGRMNTVDLPLEQIDLDAVFEEVLAQLDHEINEKHALIRKTKTLPRVHGNRVVLQVALTNLISNALKFVPPDRTPEVRVESEDQRIRTRLWVIDNGIGIAPENHSKIFGVFQRLHKNERYPGTGIGLALVSKGIERIGGSVGLESEIGKGSRFWIELKTAPNAA